MGDNGVHGKWQNRVELIKKHTHTHNSINLLLQQCKEEWMKWSPSSMLILDTNMGLHMQYVLAAGAT